jgi:phosphatidylserine/phosphatidylglycerophosphate/cardiolipin synthase-like enzyme
MIDALLRLSAADLHSFAAALRTGRVTPPYTAICLRRFLTGKAAEAIAPGMERLAATGFTPDQIATMLDFVATDRRSHPRLEDDVELVTTGPDIPGITTRDTSVVVRDLFANATSSVLIAGYAVYQGQRVFQALADRMKELPQLHARLFLDVQRAPGDASAPSELVRRFEERFRNREWPPGSPLPQVFYDPRSTVVAVERACLHAKCIVIDEQQLFVSSANFTEAAQERNVEVGLLVRSPEIASRVTRFFTLLVDEDALIRAF